MSNKSSKPQDTKQQNETRTASWNFGSVFWGSLLILVGGLLLLDKFTNLDVRLERIWVLWPLLIVAAGFSILKVRSSLSKILVVLFVILSIVLAAAVSLGLLGYSYNEVKTESKTFYSNSTQIEPANINVKSGAGNISIKSTDKDMAAKATLRSNVTSLKVSESDNGSVKNINVALDGDNIWWTGNFKNDLDLLLGEARPINLDLDIGAANLKADLSNVKLESMNLKAGASSMLIKLGSYSSNMNIDYEIGASSLDILMPKGSGIRVVTSSGLSGNNFGNLRKQSNGIYQSNNYDSATNKININGSSGLASVNIRTY